MDNNKLIKQFVANLDKKGLDSSLLENDIFDFNQKFVLYNAIRSGANLEVLANPDIDAYEMEDILDEQRDMMKEMRNNHGINPEKYNLSQLLELNDAIVHDLDISQYKNHEYTANHMYIAKTFQIEKLKGIEQLLPDMQISELINLRDSARQTKNMFLEDNMFHQMKKTEDIIINVDSCTINYPHPNGGRTTKSLGYKEVYVVEYTNSLIAQLSEDVHVIQKYDYPEITLSIQEDKIEKFIERWSPKEFEKFIHNDFYGNSKEGTCDTLLQSSENIKNIQEILKHNPGLINIPNMNGNTPLHWSKTPEKTLLLLQYGADINKLNDWGASALHTSENAYVTKILIDAGLNVDLQDSLGNTPLHYLNGGLVEEMEYLVWNNYRTSLNYFANSPDAKTLITEIELAKELISAGADIEIKNNKGEYAKVLLVPEIQQYLLDNMVNEKKNENRSLEFNLNQDVIEYFKQIDPKLVEAIIIRNEICYEKKGMILYGDHAQENPKLLFELFANNCGFKMTDINAKNVISSQQQLQCREM